jgi:acetyl esterase/lipase
MLKIVMAATMSYIAKDSTVVEQRAKFERISGITKLAKDVEINKLQVNGIPVEWITTPQTRSDYVILYTHGGGYTMGLYNSQRDYIARLGRAAGMRVLAVDYRVAPEHPFPAGLEDATTAYRWLLSKGYEPEKISLAGESSGSGLALSMLINLRDAGDSLPACVVCFSPQTDLALTGESVKTKAKADVINRPFDVAGNAARYAGAYDVRNPLISPLYADLKDLPPLLIHVGSEDILLNDSTRFADRAGEAGVDVSLKVWQGMLHAFPLQAAFIPEARKSIEEASLFIRDKVGR